MGLNEFLHLDIFMISATSTIQFPFEDRKALVSIDSNCSRHMAGFYDLLNVKPCDINVHGAFEQGSQGSVMHSGMLYNWDNYFSRMQFLFQDYGKQLYHWVS